MLKNCTKYGNITLDIEYSDAFVTYCGRGQQAKSKAQSLSCKPAFFLKSREYDVSGY